MDRLDPAQLVPAFRSEVIDQAPEERPDDPPDGRFVAGFEEAPLVPGHSLEEAFEDVRGKSLEVASAELGGPRRGGGDGLGISHQM